MSLLYNRPDRRFVSMCYKFNNYDRLTGIFVDMGTSVVHFVVVWRRRWRKENCGGGKRIFNNHYGSQR